MFKNAIHAPSFKVIVSCYKPNLSILNFFELILKAYTQGPNQNHCIPGPGASVFYMLPLLPFADKRKDFVSGSQRSD